MKATPSAGGSGRDRSADAPRKPPRFTGDSPCNSPCFTGAMPCFYGVGTVESRCFHGVGTVESRCFCGRAVPVVRANFDVVIAGAGIVGAACALELTRAGLSVAVADPAFPGAGATAAGMGHVVVMQDSEPEFRLTAW